MAKKKSSSKKPLIQSMHAKLITSILFLVVLAVGAVIALALVSKPQNNNTQAKALSCEWCGMGCVSKTSDDFYCPDVMHPEGMVCTTTIDMTGCEAVDEDVAKERGQKLPATVLPPVTIGDDPEMMPDPANMTADFNEDGIIDDTDAQFLRKRFFQNGADARQADLNGDGRVNFHDYTILRSQMSH